MLDKHSSLKVLRDLHPQVTALEVDLAEPGAWQEHLTGASAVVMLQAQIGGNDPTPFRRNNGEVLLSLGSGSHRIFPATVPPVAEISSPGQSIRGRISSGIRQFLDILGNRPWSVSIAGLLVLFLWAAAPIVKGDVGPIWDADGFFAPFYALVADFARHGRLLLWNPWSSGGSPDFADPQVGAGSPLLLLSALLTGPTSVGFRLHWLATWFVGPVGILLLARRWKVPPVGALLVALGFAFSGPFTGNAEHVSFIRSFVLLPLIVDRVEATLESRRFLPAAQAGVLWGLSAMGGYPALVFIGVMFVGLWVVGRLIFPRRAPSSLPADRMRGARRGVGLATVAGLLGALVLLPPFVGMVTEGNGYSTRTVALARDYVLSSNSLDPRGLVTMVSPYLASLPTGVLWPATDISSVDCYFGVLPLFFALTALVCRPRDAWRWWLLGMAFFFFSLAVGQALPMRGWLYDLVPPTRFFRHASSFRLPAVFALVLLALEGAKDLLRWPIRGTRSLPVLAGAIVLEGAALWTYLTVSRVATAPAQAIGDQHFLVLWTGTLIATVLWMGARSEAARRGALSLFVALAAYDANRVFALSVTVGSPETAASWRALDKVHVGSLDLLAPKNIGRIAVSNDSSGFGPGPTNKNLLVKRPAFLAYPSLKNQLFEQWANTPALLERVLPEQRIFFARTAAAGDSSPGSFGIFASYVTTSGRFPLVVEPSPVARRTGASPPTGSGLVAAALDQAGSAQPIGTRFITYDPDLLSFEVAAPADGWLLITDRWAPGWSARLDGSPVPVEIGDFLFRAVRVTAGQHIVEMRYRPWGHPFVVLISWSVVFGVLIVTVLGALRRRRILGSARAECPPLDAAVQFQLDGIDVAS